ncbi:MAG: hypothetical protein GTO63_16165 [Anaerolineae bacterium]|nr:hypothetical protein [Anaerolineae bacterium]NIN96351.1 hypothetical protein [Anaerolineae bacterium]NIQ79386.1 hypothetical protein [Anaerolineae bacterium]
MTAIVALYGAVLSTCTAVVSGYLAYCRWREKRPDIRVSISMGVRYDTEYVFVDASNPGERAVVIRSKGFFLPKRKERFVPRDYGADFVEPCELLLEHSRQWRVAASSLADELRSMGLSGEVQLVGFYEDQVGRTYKSKPFKFDVDEYA